MIIESVLNIFDSLYKIKAIRKIDDNKKKLDKNDFIIEVLWKC